MVGGRLLDPVEAGYNSVIDALHGPVVACDTDEYIGRSLKLLGEYSEQEVELLLQLCPSGGWVLDVGANVGVLTLPMARRLGAEGWLYAFEPVPTTYLQLCATIALNSLVNVKPIRAVVSDTVGEMLVADPLRHQHQWGTFATDQFNYGALGRDSWRTLVQIADIKTPVIRLDDFLDVPSLALMKVDVEGMELNVLRGASALIQQHRPCIYAENDRQECSQPLIEFLWAADYRLYWHVPMLGNRNNAAGHTESFLMNYCSFNVLAIPNERTDVQVREQYNLQKITDALEFAISVNARGIVYRTLDAAPEPDAP